MNHNRIAEAKNFAHNAHDSINQKRKYSGEPYWVHVDDVAFTVSQFGGTEDMIIAAYLHDVLEDVAPKFPNDNFQGVINQLFGADVLKLVRELTDTFTSEEYPQLKRDARKKLEAERLASISNEAKTIKLADLYNNTKSIVDNDPDFARVYLKEKARALESLRGGNQELWHIVSEQLVRSLTTLAASDYVKATNNPSKNPLTING